MTMATRDDLLRRISVDPNVCFGKPCIRGTRIWVSLIVDNLAEGVTEAELLTACPQLTIEDIRARPRLCCRNDEGARHPAARRDCGTVKFKLDEHLDWRLAAVVADSEHDADTVKDEGLSGEQDEALYKTCVADGRVLITLDLDFANPLRFPPEPTAGVVVLRPKRPILPLIEATLRQRSQH
jgi:uncharacterized protein (DUF433 family)